MLALVINGRQHSMTNRTVAADAAIEQPPRRYLTASQVLARYAISSMTLHRWIMDERLRFPPPAMRIRERRLWLESDLLLWENAQGIPAAASQFSERDAPTAERLAKNPRLAERRSIASARARCARPESFESLVMKRPKPKSSSNSDVVAFPNTARRVMLLAKGYDPVPVKDKRPLLSSCRISKQTSRWRGRGRASTATIPTLAY